MPIAVLLFLLLIVCSPSKTWALSSNNISLDSPVYAYLEKLASFGCITTDFKGIRPFTRAEAARLVAEAEKCSSGDKQPDGNLIDPLVGELQRVLSREIYLDEEPENIPVFAVKPLSSFRARYVYLDGVPRSYERLVHDPGGDGVFGIGGGLRENHPYPSPVQQRGTEGTPLLENNEGIVYRKGSNYEVRFSSEAYLGKHVSLLVEPMFLHNDSAGSLQGRLNKGYIKLGGGGLELEAGRDANWLGLGYRGNITLTNNARNFDLVKLSSPEPLKVGFLGLLKYSLIFSRFEEAVTDGLLRRPYFFAGKLSVKPAANVELGLNLGRQVGGPGVNNSAGDFLRGLIGGTGADNSNSLAGLELRLRFPFLRNTEIFGEFSGEDTALFWPIVESYVAGFYIPRLTADGRNDLRFEYFFGNAILYTHHIFPAGYLQRGLPIGHSQGGAAQEFFVRYGHWFSVKNRLALEYFHTERGNLGRVEVNGIKQAVERKNSLRGFWTFSFFDTADIGLMYGWERIHNFNLVGGAKQTNHLVRIDVSYEY